MANLKRFKRFKRVSSKCDKCQGKGMIIAKDIPDIALRCNCTLIMTRKFEESKDFLHSYDNNNKYDNTTINQD